MNKRKLVTICLASAMLLAQVTGCGQKNATEETPVQAQEASSGEASATEAKGNATAPTRENPLVLRIGTNHGSATAVVKGLHYAAELLEERSGGGLKLDIYSDGTLGDETSLRDQVSQGSLDMAALGAGVFGAYVNASNFPVSNYVWESREEMMEVLNGDLGRQYINDPVEQVSNIHVLYGWPQAARQLMTKEPVASLADISGMKIRVPAGNSLYVDTWNHYGALATSMSMNECYTALETGVIDGLEMPIDSLYSNGYYEVCKYLTMSDHMMYLQYLMINKDVFHQLSAQEQEILLNVIIDAEKLHTETLDASITEMVDDMVNNHGVTVVELTDMQAWMDATDEINQQWMDNWGQEVYDAFVP
ncbi:MAG: TRAP transporter substrate-binding protein [Lachnospiraceae bacterium]|nr:TRAP transporter substrate-binding protein [Lachnospiraceae bacterium]